MSIGQRKRIQLVQITPAKGLEGNWDSEVETSFNNWADVTNVNQFRDYQNGIVQLGQSKRFKVRFRFDMYPGADWKVRYAGRDWTVSSVTADDEKQFYWTLTASVK